MNDIYIIAGCNGAGKTTASYTVLPEVLHCTEFVNADGIAAGLSPFNPEGVAFEAGRIMLHRINELIEQGQTFAFETTLSTRSYAILVKRAQQQNYKVTLIYFWLESPEMAIRRVADRVKHGGHNIPPDVIERRYYRGITNLVTRFIPLCDKWIVFNNSINHMEIIAQGERGFAEEVKNAEFWHSITEQANNHEAGRY